MALIRAAGGIVNAGVFAFLLTVHAVLVFAHRPLVERGLPDRVPLVIVLDAGARLERGVALIEEGRADWIHFSAGEGGGLADRYAERARRRLPDAGITTKPDRSPPSRTPTSPSRNSARSRPAPSW